MKMSKLSTKQFKAGYQQSETFYCSSLQFFRYSYSIGYYHYCEKYFVNFGDHFSMQYIENSFSSKKDAYSFLENLLEQNKLHSKYM